MESRPLIGLTCRNIEHDGRQFYGVQTSYEKAIRAHGGLPIGIPAGGFELAGAYLDTIDGLLIPGGTDVDPERYGEVAHASVWTIDSELDTLEMALVQGAYERDLPLLAICRGIQVIAVALGGSLVQDISSISDSEVRHEVRELGRDHQAHVVTVAPGSKIESLIGTSKLDVNSFHHQAVKELPASLTATGWSPDGWIEAGEASDRSFFIGLQCHPEEMWETTGPEFRRVFTAFIAEAGRYRAKWDAALAE